jgi:hypothetical protein
MHVHANRSIWLQLRVNDLVAALGTQGAKPGNTHGRSEIWLLGSRVAYWKRAEAETDLLWQQVVISLTIKTIATITTV